MMGELSAQGKLFGADHLHLDHVGRDTFYGWLAVEGPRVFPDGDFREFYVLDNGRKSVPPSQLVRMVLLQWYDKTSDEESVVRSKFDLRWKVALGLEDHEGLCAKFTLQTFRGKLLLSQQGRELLKRSVQVCREAGALRSRKVRAALDTSPIIGRGAVRLGETLLESADPSTIGMRGAGEKEVREAMRLLEQLVEQDVEVREDGGAQLKQGVAKDRIVSVHDPEMRHGRKSRRVRFDGHKGEIVVDAESGTILDASAKAGNAHDAHGSLEAVERAEATLKAAWKDAPEKPSPENEGDPEVKIVETLGDCAYGSADNRRDFADAERTLTAKQPALHNGGRYTKEDFPRDDETGARTCPAGHRVLPRSRTRTWRGEKVNVPYCQWPAAVCATCPLRTQCLKACNEEDAKPRVSGRTLSEHPEETLLAKARAQQHTPEFRDAYRQRQTVEHRLARMMQLGARQARYFGRAKTELQWLIAATVANLSLAIGHKNKEKASNPTPAPSNSPYAPPNYSWGRITAAIRFLIAPGTTSLTKRDPAIRTA